MRRNTVKDTAFYVSMDQRIDSIVNYIAAHKDIYSLMECNVESVTAMIKHSAKEIFDKKTFDSFRKCIDALAKRENSAFSDINTYRLCYALKIHTLESANEFLVQYLGINPLSPRKLEEFIIIAGYRLKLSWAEVIKIIENAEKTIGKIPPSPRVLTSGDTQNMANDIEDIVLTVEDLDEYIQSELTNSYFAKTRNTQYMAFFNYMDWESYDPSQDISEFILSTWDNDTLENRHLRTFGFENEDEIECEDYTQGDHLTSDDIDTLSKIFPNTFLSYETYRHLMRRERNEQISSETMLIVLLNDVNPNKSGLGPSTDDWRFEIYQSNDYINFTNEEEFVNTLNAFLENAGCARINPNIGFDRLILDAYHDVINENRDSISAGTFNSENVKSVFFSRLRSFFKKAVSEYNN